MGKPQSFKDIFKGKKQVPFAHQQRIISSPPAPQLSAEEEARRAKAKKDLTKFVNELRCPVCGGQLDGGVNYKYAEQYCVYNNDHYKCKYESGSSLPSYTVATYNFASEAPVGYQVIANLKSDNTYANWIYKLDLDLIEKFRMNQKKLVLSFNGSLLKFPKGLSYPEFEQKLKLYAVFS